MTTGNTIGCMADKLVSYIQTVGEFEAEFFERNADGLGDPNLAAQYLDSAARLRCSDLRLVRFSEKVR